jgi:hypothetical protein
VIGLVRCWFDNPMMQDSIRMLLQAWKSITQFEVLDA